MAANKYIHELSGNTNPSLTGFTAFDNETATYKVSLGTLRQTLVDSGSHYFTGSQNINGNLIVSGSITAQQYIVSSSLINVTNYNVSGSSVFGNTLDDFHQFTGSVNITGSLIINGTSFTASTSGTSGTSGVNGTSGTSGISGSNGSSGTSGTSGSNGSSGTSGTSGSDGSSGDNGSSGTSGTSGTSGSSGTSGESGSSGTSGTSGESGSSGTSGTSGESGSSGTSGESGSSGTSGTSGESGSSGTSGTSGESGSSGTSGTSGESGTSGTSGTSGISPSIEVTDGITNVLNVDKILFSGATVSSLGSGDAQVVIIGGGGGSGSSGTSGTSGQSGSSGTSGTSGVSGTSGTSGENGSSGTSGTSGVNGTSGTAGTSGTSGSSGTSGTSGSSGTSPDLSQYNGNVIINGSLTAQQYIVSSSVYYVTESNASGSTNSGNSLDDYHNFTGSVNISGSLNITGPIGANLWQLNDVNDNITGSLDQYLLTYNSTTTNWYAAPGAGLKGTIRLYVATTRSNGNVFYFNANTRTASDSASPASDTAFMVTTNLLTRVTVYLRQSNAGPNAVTVGVYKNADGTSFSSATQVVTSSLNLSANTIQTYQFSNLTINQFDSLHIYCDPTNTPGDMYGIVIID